MAEKIGLTERAETLALDVLAGLTGPQWLSLGNLARQHTAGGLSFEGWESGSAAIIHAAFDRLAEEGRPDLAAARRRDEERRTRAANLGVDPRYLPRDDPAEEAAAERARRQAERAANLGVDPRYLPEEPAEEEA